MSNMSRGDIRDLASREAILDSSSLDEQLSFIKYQIMRPFDSGDANYFRKIRKRVSNREQMNTICESILRMISDEYSGLEFDYDDERDLVDFTDSAYKFFTKNIRKLVTIFIREYIYNNKNRKGLLSEFQDMKIPAYPKEVYGKKEHYILISKFPAIVKEITHAELRLSKFIEYIDRDDDAPLYLRLIEKYLENGTIQDHGVYDDIMAHFRDCDDYNAIITKLTTKAYNAIVIPYLHDSGIDAVRSSIVDDDDDDLSDTESDASDADEEDSDIIESGAYDNDEY